MKYSDVLEITKTNEAFKMKHQLVGDTEVAMCTYFLASPGDFFDAKMDGSMIRATELRGITFTKQKDEEEWNTHLFLDKFFNLNQTNGSNVTNMNLTINGQKQTCNINKLYADSKAEKVFRAIDLKVGLVIGEFNRNDETVGDLFTVNSLQKEILPTERPENSWMYHDVKDFDVVRVANKEDGSAIRFLILNGELVAKTKFSLEAEQCQMAMDVVNSNKKLKGFILKTLELGLTALFEIVSPFNKVVLSYKTTELKLLQIRDENGLYLDVYNNDLVDEYDVLTTHQEDLNVIREIASKWDKTSLESILGNHTFVSIESMNSFILNQKNDCGVSMSVLDYLLFMKAYIVDKEGIVITFSNGKMAKIKWDQYMLLHGILTDGLKEHKIIEKILDETIDDVVSMIPEENIEERNFIDGITTVIVNHINHLVNDAHTKFQSKKGCSQKEIAIEYKKDPVFPYIMNFVGGKSIESIEKIVMERVQFDCRRLEMAKKYLRKLGFTMELKELVDDD